MSLPEISKMKIKHEAIMDFMLANPTCTYRDVSAEFGVTVPWVSCIVNSPCFQEKLAARQGEMFEAGVLVPLEGKMRGVADLALMRLAEKVQTCESLNDLTNTADKVLGRLGYGTRREGSPDGQVNNFFGTTLIARAQALIGNGTEMLGHAGTPDLGHAGTEVLGHANGGEKVNGNSGEGDTQPSLSGNNPASALFDEIESQRGESVRSPLRAEGTPLDGTEI